MKNNVKIFALMMAMLPFSALSVNALPVNVNLQEGYVDPTENQEGPKRTPAILPEVIIEDYTLSFDHSCLGCTLRLVDGNDNVVYTTVVNGDTLVLPSTLSGEYELQILFDDCYFFGFVGF